MSMRVVESVIFVCLLLSSLCDGRTIIVRTGTKFQAFGNDFLFDSTGKRFPAKVWNAAKSPDGVRWTLDQCIAHALAVTNPGRPLGIMHENNRRCWVQAQLFQDFIQSPAIPSDGVGGTESAVLPLAQPVAPAGDPSFVFEVLETAQVNDPTASPTNAPPTNAPPTTARPTSAPPAGSPPGSPPVLPPSQDAGQPNGGDQTEQGGGIGVILGAFLGCSAFIGMSLMLLARTSWAPQGNSSGQGDVPPRQTGYQRWTAAISARFSRSPSFAFQKPSPMAGELYASSYHSTYASSPYASFAGSRGTHDSYTSGHSRESAATSPSKRALSGFVQTMPNPAFATVRLNALPDDR